MIGGFGLGPTPYGHVPTRYEEAYNRAFSNQLPAISDASAQAMKLSKIGKHDQAREYYRGVKYVYYIMHYACLIKQYIEFQAQVSGVVDMNVVRDRFRLKCMEQAFPCMSFCKGIDLVSALKQTLNDFGIGVLLEPNIPFCPGIGKMIINGADLNSIFELQGPQCSEEGSFGEWSTDEFINEEVSNFNV